jgi:hypothetical protein
MLNSKKVLSMVLALAMAATMAVPAFADGDEDAGTTPTNGSTQQESSSTTPANTLVMNAAYEEIAIEVTVPTTGTAQINPYGLPIAVTLSDNTEKKITGQQITSVPTYMSNNGDVALDVSATVAAETKGDLNLVTTAPTTTGKNASTAKDAYVYLQMLGIDVDKKVQGTNDTDILDAVKTACVTESNWSSATKVVLNPDEETSGSKLVTLAAATVAGTGSSKTVTYAANSVAAIRLAGSVVTSPEEAWATTDGFTATIAFTFTPAES